MYTVYVIRSLSHNYRYVGLSNNLERRLNDHNKGYNKTTRPYAPFRIIYTKTFSGRREARWHEKFLKSGNGRGMLDLIENKQ